MPSDKATSEEVWTRVMEAGREFGIIPCGLGARNTLRLEAKMALYGHEISDTINVWEAGLDRYCKMEKGDFIGRAALERAKAAGLTRTLVGLEMIDRGIARDEYCCCNEAGEAIGVVTSGSPSPTLGKNIALAYVPPAMSALGTPIYVEIRGQQVQGAGGSDSVLQAAEDGSRTASCEDSLTADVIACRRSWSPVETGVNKGVSAWRIRRNTVTRNSMNGST